MLITAQFFRERPRPDMHKLRYIRVRLLEAWQFDSIYLRPRLSCASKTNIVPCLGHFLGAAVCGKSTIR
jgi:hypothetical protein